MKFDPKQGKTFEGFYTKISHQLLRVMKPGGYFISFSQPRLYHRMTVAVENVGFEIRDQYAWHYTKKSQMKAFSMEHFIDKKNISDTQKNILKSKLMGRKTPQLRPQFESILLAQKPKEGTFVENWLLYETGLIDASVRLTQYSPSTVIQIEKPVKEAYNHHLTVKPIKLLEHLIQIFSKKNQIVLDCFIGSGTTAIACIQTNRHYIGMEIDPTYIDIAHKRIKQSLEKQNNMKQPSTTTSS